MQIHFAICEPDDVMFAMTIRMTLKQWRELYAQLDARNPPLYSPAGQLGSKIVEMSLKAKHYWADHGDEEESE